MNQTTKYSPDTYKLPPFFRYSILYSSVLISLNSFAASQIIPPGDVNNSNTAMQTLEDLYSQLNSGTSSAKRSTVFIEPSSGPASSGHNLNDIMGIAPSVDDTNGAKASDVLDGKTFWGLRSDGTWGNTTGTGTNVAKTGQTECYDASGNIENPCVTTQGQDGDLEKGMAVSPRFTDNSNGTISDNLTGLMWLKDASCGDLSDSSGNLLSNGVGNWYQALHAANSLKSGECNLSDDSSPGDWRLPNIKELRSLIDYGHNFPALSSGHPFIDVGIGRYWSSTTYIFLKHQAFTSNIYNSDASGNLGVDKIGQNKTIWPVKGGK